MISKEEEELLVMMFHRCYIYIYLSIENMISLRTKQKQSQLNQIRKQDVLNFLEKTHDIFKIP